MNSSTICSLFLGLILISQSPFAANARVLGLGGGGGRGPLVSLLCAASSNKVECNKVLSSPQITQAKNYKQLSKAVIEMALKKAVEGQAFLKGLAQKNPKLETCAGFAYDGVVGSFKSCLGEITEDPQTASYDCGVVGDGPTQCDRIMADAHIVNPAITALNKQILFLSSLASRAVDKL
ncbi:uncharacterized protein [Medicago truncatula]|uniref:Plant invertase/pectin methylesterase inhibitor protein n=2 Tax=Medicago truncatula TaxID=3880 RepID=G7IBW8_MEDTR|nr:uncharacterized protein LOC11416334 [Medicago truncatula]AES62322.1 plant invertase/pectin methylesterase inhibitor protein [Medicago truncatula]AFK41109.1 unknown [Medicago truncatula]